eukprot:1988193-Rhodomonas_salina.1
MHKTDLESGEFMDETEAAQSAASTQPAQQEESQDWGVEPLSGARQKLLILQLTRSRMDLYQYQ